MKLTNTLLAALLLSILGLGALQWHLQAPERELAEIQLEVTENAISTARDLAKVREAAEEVRLEQELARAKADVKKAQDQFLDMDRFERQLNDRSPKSPKEIWGE